MTTSKKILPEPSGFIQNNGHSLSVIDAADRPIAVSAGYPFWPYWTEKTVLAAAKNYKEADYEAAQQDHKALVRELDVLLNGSGAAQQASLCDIVSQVRREMADVEAPDMSKRLLQIANDGDLFANRPPHDRNVIVAAAYELTRYYKGMIAWKKTAEAKDQRTHCCKHDSNCAAHNMPYAPAGPCDCSKSDQHAVALEQAAKVCEDQSKLPECPERAQYCADAIRALKSERIGQTHPDDIAIDKFAAAMKAEMAKRRAMGRGGWENKDECETRSLQELLVNHITKGNPVHVGNVAMMLFNRGERTAINDASALRPMLQLLQNCEMSVARAVELIELWTVGNYDDSMLPDTEPEPDAELTLELSFQECVQPWLLACFGAESGTRPGDKEERSHRFFEEATELVQACGMTEDEANQLIRYTFNRPVGDKKQEVGGVMVTLAALCLAHDIDMQQEGNTELARVWMCIEKIRAKQASKPKFSPLPGTYHEDQK